MTSVKGSPGVTTLALSLLLAWQRPALLAELDPAGGDLRPRILPSLTGSHQLLNLATLDERLTSAHLTRQVVSLDPPDHSRVLLPGLSDPATSAPVAQIWDELAEVLAGYQHRAGDPYVDVLADCGRLGHAHTPSPVLARADVVVVVLRARLDAVALATPVLQHLRRRPDARILPVLVQDGPYSPRDIDSALGAQAERIAFDAKGAALLESGRWGKKLEHTALLRSARALSRSLIRTDDARRSPEAFLEAGQRRV
ncbi:hypothetical protein ABZ249_16285 [Nocardiopsis sp. NPDC006139]|uniref:hypothetical protein n=1 Tax=Nocardiopsis sp. NPDC006139 TaxID=3154578 RepID=UPI0033B7F04A